MTKYIFKIQSVSDIITNSSTEVFMVYNESAFKSIRELVNAILETTGVEYRFDDLFDIKAVVDDAFIEDYPEYASMSEEEMVQKALKFDEDNDGWPYVNSYKVTAKNPKDEKLAKVLSHIDSIFETYSRYC
jgi:hypothetical protein